MTGRILLSLLMILPAIGVAQTVDAAVDLYEHGKYQNAAGILSEFSRQNPEDVTARIWLGKTYLKLRRWDDAIRELEKAVELDPKNAWCHLWLGRAYGNKASHALLPLILAGKTRQEFETAVQLAPDNLEARFDLLQFYAEAPGLLGGGKEKAEAQAREIARISARNGYTARAEIYENKEQWDQARDELTQATMTFPNDPDGFVDLAAFLLDRKDYAGAETAAQKALALDTSIRAARMLLSAARIRLNRNASAALKVLQELAAGPLTDKDPGFGEVFYWLGQAWLAQGQKAEARKAFETSLSFDPDYSQSKDALKQVKRLT